MTHEQFSVASAHGRFQPLHKGHLEYLLAAKQRCAYLFIGITQFDVFELQASPQDSHRADPLNNPLSYFERVEMVTNAMLEAGLELSQFGTMPFPIERPSSLPNFLPREIPILTTIYEAWNEYKVRLLESLGYKVHVLWRRDKKAYSGMDVRHSLRAGDTAWRELVPAATARIVEKYKLMQRLQSAP